MGNGGRRGCEGLLGGGGTTSGGANNFKGPATIQSEGKGGRVWGDGQGYHNSKGRTVGCPSRPYIKDKINPRGGRETRTKGGNRGTGSPRRP